MNRWVGFLACKFGRRLAAPSETGRTALVYPSREGCATPVQRSYVSHYSVTPCIAGGDSIRMAPSGQSPKFSFKFPVIHLNERRAPMGTSVRHGAVAKIVDQVFQLRPA
jgi:hypothetical protein